MKIILFQPKFVILVSVWLVYFLSTYFTILFIFGIIHKYHYTILTNIYFYLQYFQ